MANIWSGSGQTLVDTNGVPYASWKLYTYDTGTTTNKATYSEAGLTSANANPVVADAAGRMGLVYFIAGRYKLVFKTSADVTIGTYDPVDGSVEFVTSATAPSPAYPFLLWYDTTSGNRKRRNAANSAWIDEGPIDGLISAATVTEQLTGTDATKASTPDSVASLWQRGTDIASAATLSLPGTGGGVFNVTGTTGISAIGSAQGGRTIKLRFAGACLLTYNATSFILPGAANLTTVAGDCLEFINEGAADASSSNWRCFNIETFDGRLIASATQALQESAASLTFPVTPGVQQYHPGSAKWWLYSIVTAGVPANTVSHNVTSIADTGVGIITVTIATDFSSATWCGVGACTCTTATGEIQCFGSLAAGSVQARTYLEANSGGISDSEASHTCGFGDQ
jgi:hypothetical protein